MTVPLVPPGGNGTDGTNGILGTSGTNGTVGHCVSLETLSALRRIVGAEKKAFVGCD